MYLIALTGGIASGKSTISRRFEELGAVTLDADQLARLVVSPGWPALEEIGRVFGEDVMNPDGTLNRAALGAVVFGNEELLQQLNSIVHPAIRDHVASEIQNLTTNNPDGVLVYEIPLLVESKNKDVEKWDLIVVAESPEEERIRRMVELRGMTKDEARARLSHQATNEDRREIADVIIDTSGTLEQTLEQTDALWQRINASKNQSQTQ